METTKPTKFETRPVLAGTYISAKTLLTHLVDAEADGETALCGGVVPGHMADRYSMTEEGLKARPTCPRCAKRWDRAAGVA